MRDGNYITWFWRKGSSQWLSFIGVILEGNQKDEGAELDTISVLMVYDFALLLSLFNFGDVAINDCKKKKSWSICLPFWHLGEDSLAFDNDVRVLKSWLRSELLVISFTSPGNSPGQFSPSWKRRLLGIVSTVFHYSFFCPWRVTCSQILNY